LRIVCLSAGWELFAYLQVENCLFICKLRIACLSAGQFSTCR
jgi:hypothetical protein